MPNLLVVIVLALIRAVQIFDEVFVLTGGGPGSATLFIVQFIYQTGVLRIDPALRHRGRRLARARLVLLVLTLVQLRVTRRKAGSRGA